MNAASEDLASVIDTSAIGLSLGTNLFVSQLPESPDECVALIDQGGFAPELNYVYEKPSLQVIVRGDRGDYRAAYALARAISDALHALHGLTVSGTRYVLVFREGDIISVGKDESHRPLLSVNFGIHRTDA